MSGNFQNTQQPAREKRSVNTENLQENMFTPSSRSSQNDASRALSAHIKEPDAGNETCKNVDGNSVKKINQEDKPSVHMISASELENLLKREAAVSKMEKDLYTSVIYIFVGLAISAAIIIV